MGVHPCGGEDHGPTLYGGDLDALLGELQLSTRGDRVEKQPEREVPVGEVRPPGVRVDGMIRIAGLVPEDVVALPHSKCGDRTSLLAFLDVVIQTLLSESEDRFVFHRRGLSPEPQLVGVPRVEVGTSGGHGLVPPGRPVRVEDRLGAAGRVRHLVLTDERVQPDGCRGGRDGRGVDHSAVSHAVVSSFQTYSLPSVGGSDGGT